MTFETSRSVLYLKRLVCIEHDNWDGTLASIREKGGKAGNDWVNNKESISSCWTYGKNAGDSNSNLIESVHSDVNREGVHCTLLGGLQKAQRFNTLKMNTLITYKNYGITLSYKTGHISKNVYSNLKHKANSQHRMLEGEDRKIECYNKKPPKSLNNLAKAKKAAIAKEQELLQEGRPEKRQKIKAELEKKQRAEGQALKAFEKQHTETTSLKKESGKVARIEYMMQ
ncbi:hypothetical protein DFH08DRAFT_806761 [Mycena albidolilacea]|uniref:Uncharacterized protein n=1 Tax=Mycena albidolilacea TaxID=1033008 RepID=A0AAD7EV26_9AGAR|nr:hypothetical protein DFH08DRAFT_806761 [Mycena albidolilacea]